MSQTIISSSLPKLLSDRKRYIAEFRANIEHIPLKDAISYWIEHDLGDQRQKYYKEIGLMIKEGIIPETFADGKDFTIGGFRHIRPQAVLDHIKNANKLSDSRKQQLINCFSSLLEWIDEMSFGWFNRELLEYQLSPHAMKQTISFSDWRTFIDVLYDLNQRDSIIARCLLQGERRVSDVLGLTLDQIDFENNTIVFAKKTIHYEPRFIKELKSYIDTTAEQREKSSHVFITRNGKPVTRTRLNHAFTEASKQANIKKITPDSLRGIWKMFIQQQYQEKDIMHNKKSRQEDTKKLTRGFPR